MFGTAVIVFREVLEAALIIGILTATTRNVLGRTKWINGGILVGLIGSFLLALVTGDIAELAGGFGQEIFAISVLTLAVVMFALTAIAVLREGSETVLFLYGLINTHDANTQNMLIGGLIGLASGVLFGYILFFGLLKIPVQWFFKWLPDNAGIIVFSRERLMTSRA
ncbi:MAG: hypothetical protein EBX02_00675 [Betaproteobacteria bacterium]|nr:hypothetical protein [Betaproteobacteria bacterium]